MASDMGEVVALLPESGCGIPQPPSPIHAMIERESFI
jgi:hypothetical protein